MYFCIKFLFSTISHSVFGEFFFFEDKLFSGFKQYRRQICSMLYNDAYLRVLVVTNFIHRDSTLYHQRRERSMKLSVFFSVCNLKCNYSKIRNLHHILNTFRYTYIDVEGTMAIMIYQLITGVEMLYSNEDISHFEAWRRSLTMG